MPAIYSFAMIDAGAICSVATTADVIILVNAVKLNRLRFPESDRKIRACFK
jgi:hypothetical protein